MKSTETLKLLETLAQINDETCTKNASMILESFVPVLESLLCEPDHMTKNILNDLTHQIQRLLLSHSSCLAIFGSLLIRSILTASRSENYVAAQGLKWAQLLHTAIPVSE